MDKYARHSHLTFQRARRKNNTAQHQLENHLRQLDKDIRSEKVNHRRNTDKVISELESLESVSSDFYEEEINIHETYRGLQMNGNILQNSKSAHSYPNTDKNSSNSSSNSNLSQCKYHEFSKSSKMNSPSSVTKSLGITKNAITFKGGDENEKSTTTADDDISSFNTPRSCCYFPCKLPETYQHTLGFRRDDLCPRTDDDPNQPPQEQDQIIAKNLGIKHEHRVSGSSLNGETSKEKSKSCNNINTNWIKTDKKSDQSVLSATPNGPIFGFRPTDPLLEHIRLNRSVPKLNDTRTQRARVSIQDRIRGVKQLVKEMKESNDKVKPEDWAVNYGKRVPTRILLNPVVPV